MSKDKIEKILATYEPVKDKPGYMWVNNETIAKLKDLSEAYEKQFKEK